MVKSAHKPARQSPRFSGVAAIVKQNGDITTLGSALAESLGVLITGIVQQSLNPITGALNQEGRITFRIDLTDGMFTELLEGRALKALDALIEQHGAVIRILVNESGTWESVNIRQHTPSDFLYAHAIQFHDGTVFDKVNGRRRKK